MGGLSTGPQIQAGKSGTEMKAPVIVVSDVMWLKRDLRSLGRCNRLAWVRGYFENVRYFDADGHVWRVDSCRPTRPSGRLSRWLTHVYNPRMTVELTFAAPTPYALEDLAEILCELVDQDPDDLYDQRNSHEALKRRIRSARSFDGLGACATDSSGSPGVSS